MIYIKSIFLKFFLFFFLLQAFLGCSSQRVLTHPAVDFAIANVWFSDTCATGNKAIFVEKLLEVPMRSMDTTLAYNWFNQPIHKRYLLNGHVIYVYYFSGSPESINCKYGDLFCIEFDSKGKLVSNFLYFITEDEETTLFWHSGEVPSRSLEGVDNNNFFLSIPTSGRRQKFLDLFSGQNPGKSPFFSLQISGGIH
jgi:hypothetical protein